MTGTTDMLIRMAEAGLTKTQAAYVLGIHLSTFSKLSQRLGVRHLFRPAEYRVRSRAKIAEAKERCRNSR